MVGTICKQANLANYDRFMANIYIELVKFELNLKNHKFIQIFITK